ncbi:hypothetical protein [Streptomyces purpurogeneiscleroticus]|uniref:hypothetical protein n=1 Tax=Streptomyces purpurogeneiscleroticus TaxID=68259 RepID=UPI001CBC324D|nr:hypothetical protein [Streptomyces purpurogeneiscleroticus]MBZ4015034.1 hypothetical protein [Streptomyces purpurogeneiscleroticus]
MERAADELSFAISRSASSLDLLGYSVTSMRERSEFLEQLPVRRNADALLVISFALDVDRAPTLQRVNRKRINRARPTKG